jgi:BirA family transcriptional regulator, biotin operon repressor / biotin---[acetyl-CoA-carboxylase] ligase
MIAALKRLDSRQFQSADALGCALAIAPAAAIEALRQAEGAGAPLEHVAGRGYRLCEALDWLDAGRIEAAIAGCGLTLRVVDHCGSTNLELMAAARRGGPSGQVLAAELQMQGRGRLGRRWHSGLCSALTFSLLWRFGRPVSALEGLSLAVGVAIARALRRHGVQAELKWPNDLLWRNCKLGGVLIEVHGQGASACAAVIGIGINVRLRAFEREQIDQAATDLNQAGGAALSRSDWLAAILMELSRLFSRFEREGFAPMRGEWDRYHAHAGRAVELALPNGGHLHGIATGVDDNGHLLLATDAGMQPVRAGDVSLRASA